MSAIRNVVIAGRDAAAWLTANALSRALGATGLNVTVVELPGLLRAQDVYASQPALEAFHRLLGFEESEILKACGGSYSLGQTFANFAHTRPAFLQPYGSHGAALNRLPFHQLWIKARQLGLNVAFEDFSLSAVAAKQGRFFVANAEMAAFGRCDYAYHLRAGAYVGFLKAHALRRGVTLHQTRHVAARLDADGLIDHLVLADGTEVEGDLFIDATGAESRLLGEALKVGSESWAHWFPANRVLTAAGERLRTLPSHSQVKALDWGTLHMLPTQDMTGLMHVYDGGATSDDEAFRAMAVTAGLRVSPDATVSSLAAGRRHVAWSGNCVAIGEAACVFDPIVNPGLHSIQLGLAHLIALFPTERVCALEAQEYNRNIQRSFERFRDFQLTHYALNKNFDRPFWDHLRTVGLPDMLAHKIEVFQARGLVVLYDEETFQFDEWLAAFFGHGLMPRSYDPLADLVPQDEAIRHVQSILGFIRQHIEEMSSHDAYVEMFASRDFA